VLMMVVLSAILYRGRLKKGKNALLSSNAILLYALLGGQINRPSESFQTACAVSKDYLLSPLSRQR
ncbi:MAG TPA: hypothetical protein PL031_05585, partial [Neisseria sp.]|nr:hypothetical protein [Neisseria sp.]